MAKYYVAYGSNLNIAQMRRRCPDATIHGTSEIPGYRLVYKGSMTGAYLTIERAEGHSVPVGIWRVSERDERSLDRYEGYPDFYRKAHIGFTDDAGNALDCFIYIMREDRRVALPTEWYVETCREGYRDFGFDTAVLDEALAHSREVLA